jgi:hypothetical protein
MSRTRVSKIIDPLDASARVYAACTRAQVVIVCAREPVALNLERSSRRDLSLDDPFNSLNLMRQFQVQSKYPIEAGIRISLFLFRDI